MKVILYYSILFLFLVSCSNTNEQKQLNSKNISLIPSDTIILNLPADVKYGECFKVYKYKNEETIGTSLMRKNRVLIFDKNKGTILEDFKIEKEGPNGVGYARGLLYINNDSIFVIRRTSNKIYLINSKSEIKKKWITSDAKNMAFHNNVYASANDFPLAYHNDKIYCKKFTNSYFGDKAYQNDNHLVIFNLKDNTIKNNVYSFPKEYKREIKYNIDSYSQSCQINKDGNAIVCFYLTPDIYLYSDTGLINSYNIPSKYVNDNYDEYPKTDISKDITARENFDIQRGNYRWLKYDKKRDYIIRLVLHKSELYDEEGNKNRLYDKEFSLQIINNKFELIGEQKFTKNTFYLWNIIPVEDGLLISINNDKNPSLEEDKVKFVLYKYSNE